MSTATETTLVLPAASETSAPARRPKVVVVMPALNAAKTLEMTVGSISRDVVDEIILVDDKSTDDTVELAKRLDIRVIWHPHNVGYGGNQKTCYLDALQRDPDIVVMLHPDGQYDASMIPDLIRPIVEGKADLVLGSRLAEKGMAARGGMPRYKIIANRFLTTCENIALGTHLSEMHTGYRAYSRELLLNVPFLRNSLGFSFDSEMLMQAVHFGFRIAEVPAHSRYFEEASSVDFKDGVIYGCKTLWMAGRFLMNRTGVVPCRKLRP
jgi:glycosyltransferase involved in cell wall biosynthesis